jgi:hypothetical protein
MLVNVGSDALMEVWVALVDSRVEYPDFDLFGVLKPATACAAAHWIFTKFHMAEGVGALAAIVVLRRVALRDCERDDDGLRRASK